MLKKLFSKEKPKFTSTRLTPKREYFPNEKFLESGR